MSERIKAARRQIENLTYQELLTLRDDVANLLVAYESGGALTGRGSIELKFFKRTVRRKLLDEATDLTLKPKFIDCGPYAYIRRWSLNEKGRVSLTSSGYYGTGGAQAVEAGLGEQLLEAHLNGGEPAGDDFLAKHGFNPPYRRPIRNKPPAAPPVHPLDDDSITSENIPTSPIFIHYQQNAPIDAALLLQELHHYEADLASYRDAEQKNLAYRLSSETLTERRKRASRRQSGQPPRRIRRT